VRACMQPIPSPLHLAAKAHNEVLVRLFLEFGLDINLRDEEGRTPLHAAVGYGPASPRFTRLLLDHGADATAVDNQGSTAFHHLIYNGLVVRTCLQLHAHAHPYHTHITHHCLAMEGFQVCANTRHRPSSAAARRRCG
jgi:ankyrin repeat protein